MPSVLDRIRADPRVASVDDERHGPNNDGVWVYLKPGYTNSSTECAMIHEPTATAALRVLRQETRRTDGDDQTAGKAPG